MNFVDRFKRSRLWLVPLFFIAFVSVVQAAPTRIGLTRIVSEGASPEVAAVLNDSLKRNLSKLHGVEIEERTMDLSATKTAFGCDNNLPVCLVRVGRSLGVHRVLSGTLREAGPNYVLQLRHFNVADNTFEKILNETVPKPLLVQPGPRLDELWQRWLNELLMDELRSTLVINTTPPGAQVSIDGELADKTPHVAQKIEVGRHVLKVELAGFEPVSRTVQVHVDQSETLDFVLRPALATGVATTAQPTHDKKRPSLVPILRYTAYGLFGVAAVSGIAALGTSMALRNAQDRAGEHVDVLMVDLGSRVSDYADFFQSRTQLSRCQGPNGLSGMPAYEAYAAECRGGMTLASASTGLWITAGVLTTVGATTLLATYFLTVENAPGSGTKTALTFAPVVFPSGAAVHAAMQF